MFEGLFMYLLPGLAVSFLVSKFTDRKDSQVKLMIEGALFSLFIYWAIAFLPSGFIENHPKWIALIVVMLVAIISLVFTLMINKDWLIKSNVTEFYDNSTFSRILSDSSYSLVHLKNGVMIWGYISHYSTNPEDKIIYIKRCSYYGEDGVLSEMTGVDGVLINFSEISYIQKMEN